MCSSSVPTTDRTQHDDIPSAAAAAVTATAEAADLSRARNNQDFTHKYYEPSHARGRRWWRRQQRKGEEGEKDVSSPALSEQSTPPHRGKARNV